MALCAAIRVGIMKISADSISKKFVHHHVFRNVQLTLESPHSYALLGVNGSGKSTLLRILAGMQQPSKGKLVYSFDGHIIPENVIFKHISFCAPGMDIIEEMSLKEFLQFHFHFKKPLAGLSVTDIIELMGIKNAGDKLIGDFSSGMKQRVKLAQAIFSDTAALFLDEPCTNLDDKGVAQYQHWMRAYSAGRLVVIASNDEREYDFCEERIPVDQFK